MILTIDPQDFKHSTTGNFPGTTSAIFTQHIRAILARLVPGVNEYLCGID
jgi:hypothetical protein